MTTVGRWSPNKVRARVLDGTWVSTEELGGMVLLTPTSIAYTGTSASIGANGSVTFSACSSLSLNGVFSADYDNYMIVFRYKTSASGGWYWRLRLSGADNSTANSYTDQQLRANSTTVSGTRGANAESYLANGDNTYDAGFIHYIYGPHLAQPTAGRTITIDPASGAYIQDSAHTHNQSTAYDGFTYVPWGVAGITASGLVSVYGLVGA
jgi:hypothetical protein